MGHHRHLFLAAIGALTLGLGAACSSSGGGDLTATATSSPAGSEAPATATDTAEPATNTPATDTPTNSELSTQQLVELAEPSVVRVSLPTGVGSGFIIDPEGYIITNNHVVESAPQSVEVTLADGSVYSAAVLGRDSSSDLAVLKIEAADELPALPLADLTDINVGEDVLAIGYALDLSGGDGPPSVTRGIVSALNRAIPTSGILGAIQTDAAINHGNSGGPLINYRGQVVGINTSLAPDTTTGGVAQNIGFAVGSDTVGAVYNEITDKGNVDRARLGIGGNLPDERFAAIRPAEAEFLGLPRDTEGVLVGPAGVSAGGPAAAAGMQGNDVIVRIGDHDIMNESDLAVAMIIYDPGDTVGVEVFRDGTRVTLDVTLGSPDNS